MILHGRSGALASCLLAAILFGLATPVGKVLLDESGPLLLAGLLYLGAALGVLPAAMRRSLPGGPRLAPKRVQLLRIAGSVILGGGIGPVLLLLALRLASATSVSLWLPLESVLTGLLAWAAFREHLGRRALLSYGLIVASGILLVAPATAGSVTAALLAAGACACWAIDNNLSALVDAITPARFTLVKGAAAGAVNLALGLGLEPQRPGTVVVVAALATGAACYGASIVLFLRGAQVIGAARSQALFATAPFFGALAAASFLPDSSLTLSQAGSAVLAACGVALLLSGSHAHAHGHQQMAHEHAHCHDDLHHDHAHDPPVPPGTLHSHSHEHGALAHSHPHEPDLHHRHAH